MKQRFLVYTKFVFDGVFDVIAENNIGTSPKQFQEPRNTKLAWLLFFAFEQAGDQSKEAKESRGKINILSLRGNISRFHKKVEQTRCSTPET